MGALKAIKETSVEDVEDIDTTAVVPMTRAVVGTITTGGAGAVDITTAGVGGTVTTNGAGSVQAFRSTRAMGALNVTTAGSGAVQFNGHRGGFNISTISAGSVQTSGGVGNIDTTHAGSVKIRTKPRLATGTTGSRVGNATGVGGANITGSNGVTIEGGVADTTVSANGNGDDGPKLLSKVVAAALVLLVDCTLIAGPMLNRLLGVVTHGNKLAFVLTSAADMHARGVTGWRIMYASIAMLLVGVGYTYMFKK